MNFISSFPHEIHEIENAWIPLADGTRLACRIFLPKDAAEKPVPAILEYIPYRKRDFTALRDQAAHGYFAGHGYAGVRVDIRGSGDSDGILEDEYTPQELDDAVEVIAWLASQEWCNGSVGMMGNSWGGFNALQVAAMRPAALKAIITCCSTDDRYADDMHYSGGCLLNDNMDWGTMFLALIARPPDPELVGESWRDIWLKRLDDLIEPISHWLRHPLRDEYWRRGSICEDYGDIACAVLAVGGWMDGYSNAIPRLLENLTCPRQGIIGPWAHGYPHLSSPGPQIGFLQEAVRWWDAWLKGIDNGVAKQPMLRAFMGQAVPALPYYPVSPGRWIAEQVWPSPNIEHRRWYLGEGRLSDDESPACDLTTLSPMTTGLASGEWCPYGTGGQGPEFPADQREDDGRSLCFDSAPLDDSIDIVGAPSVTLRVSVDKPVAYVVVRLCDVAPTGASTRVSFAALNLTHRNGHADVVPMSAGAPADIEVKLNDIAYSFRQGHRIRVAVSTVYWPMIWPAPEPVFLTVHTQGCRLHLPVRNADPALEIPVLFGPPEQASIPEKIVLRQGSWENAVNRDVKTGCIIVTATRDDGIFRIAGNGLEIGSRVDESMSLTGDDPLSAITTMDRRYYVGRGDWQTRLDARTEVTCSADAFFVKASIQAYEGDVLVHQNTWNNRIERHGL